jgi:tRNA A-37 threonylcarbamoyl transferase component Bud32
MRNTLARLGVPTPALISMSQDELVEEYVEEGDLYRALASGSAALLANEAGRLTAILHNAGLAFADNKAQNFLVRDGSLLRTDLAFIQENKSTFARSMDVGSFLASVMDLPGYPAIEREFYNGYREQAGRRFPYLSLVIRNLLSLGFSSDGKTALQNMMLNSSRLVG